MSEPRTSYYPRPTYRVRSPQGDVREFSTGGQGDDLLMRLLAEGWVLLQAWPPDSMEAAPKEADHE
jgi:hypothetical protein